MLLAEPAFGARQAITLRAADQDVQPQGRQRIEQLVEDDVGQGPDQPLEQAGRAAGMAQQGVVDQLAEEILGQDVGAGAHRKKNLSAFSLWASSEAMSMAELPMPMTTTRFPRRSWGSPGST